MKGMGMVTGISFHRGPVGELGRGLVYWGLSETGEGYVEKALETGIHRGPAGEPGRGLIYQGL
jgi:hypothetical protein